MHRPHNISDRNFSNAKMRSCIPPGIRTTTAGGRASGCELSLCFGQVAEVGWYLSVAPDTVPPFW